MNPASELRRTPELHPSNPWGSTEPRLRTTWFKQTQSTDKLRVHRWRRPHANRYLKHSGTNSLLFLYSYVKQPLGMPDSASSE